MIDDQPNATAQTEDFEFAALAQAQNYRQALFDEFGTFLKGQVIEVGAGIGQMTERLVGLPGVTKTLAIEPDPGFCVKHREQFPHHELLEGTAGDLPSGTDCDAILSINVLEHICEDEAELRLYARMLHARSGHLCLFVPARPEIYAPIDKDFGHFRRYTRRGLREKLEHAGFHILRLYYFNLIGYFAWWANFCLLKKRNFEAQKVRFYDRVIFPGVHTFESKILRPPFGQSLLAVAQG